MKRISIIVVCVVTIVLTAGCLCGCGAGSKSDQSEKVKYNIGDAQVSDPIENIEIDWVGGKVDLETHEEKTVDISEKCDQELSEDLKMHWIADENTLRIKWSEPGFKFEIGESPKKDLKVMIPKDIELGALKVDATDTSVNGKALKANNTDIDITSGSIDLDCIGDTLTMDATSGKIKAAADMKKIDIESTSGSIDLLQTGSADKVDIDTTSGDSKLKLEKVESLTIDGTSSDIQISLPKKAGFKAEVDMTSGSFSSDIAMKKTEETYVAGDGSILMHIDTTSGDVNILGY